MAKRSWIAGRDGVAKRDGIAGRDGVLWADAAKRARIAMVDTAEQNKIAE